MSAAIIPFLRDSAFDPETTRAMGAAYDKARQLLHDKGQPYLVQEVIARRIIEIAKTGERDPDKISLQILKALGIESNV